MTLLFQYTLIYGWLLPLFTGSAANNAVVESGYDVVRNGKVVGYMQCSKRVEGNVVEYTNESTVKVSVIVDVNIHNKLQSAFVNGQLDRGSIKRVVNGKTKTDTKISWTQDKYRIDADGKISTYNNIINVTTAGLMYEEPVNITRIYSENFRQYVPIKKTGPNQYVLQLPDGYDNIYTYKNGKCSEVEVHTSLATVYIKSR